ncbi:MAG: SEC-C domain-containing protein [Candidatus Nitrosocosmicus sp.]|nr:SEC-C domain-containing protein [Candidatus Nitrosocosmicus sp.]MDN5866766.1 SEC-C domain-containing protein [Candidatus Nitrosocosmicus sp.]
MNTKRNDPCSCESGKKFKHCCIDLYNKRQKWNYLEETVRSIVEESFEKFSSRRFIADALKTFDKDVDFEDISERRLFFDWLIHDYEIKDESYDKSSFTIIQKTLENLKNEHSIEGYRKEIETLEMWTHSAFRFYEVIDIKKGHGYTVIDVFDNSDTDKHLFLFDHSTSFTINKHDVIYTRLYNVGDILRPAGGVINCPRGFLPFIKDYVIHSSQKYYNSKNKTNIKRKEKEIICNNKEKPKSNEYFRKESVSIIKYLDSLNSDDNTTPVLTTAQGDPATLSRSSFLIIKSVRRFLSILDSSEEFVELENEGSTTLRYDWVEKLDANSNLLGSSPYNPSSIHSNINKDVDDDHDNNSPPSQPNLGTVHPSEELSFHTILWVPVDEDEEEDEKYGKRRSRNNTGRFIPYRVLGNLDITGKTLFIECLSDSLLFRCNNLLESIAGKYLRHMGNTFMEIPSTTSKEPSAQHSNMISGESVNSYQYDEEEEEDDYIDERTQYNIENSFKNMLRQHYDNWITTKNPYLNNKTPLQAARTKEGKESLKELLEVMENDFYRRKDRGVMEDLPFLPFEKIRKKLGLK